MRQISFDTRNVMSLLLNKNDKDLKVKFELFKRGFGDIDYSRAIIFVSTTICMKLRVTSLLRMLSDVFSGAKIVCNSSAGNIYDNSYHPGVSISMILFEDDSTVFDVKFYEIKGQSEAIVAKQICDYVDTNLWVKGVEFYYTMYDSNTTAICNALSKIREDVVVFGGVCCNEDLMSNFSFVSDSYENISESGIIVVYYGGDNFFVDSVKVSGWKPIKRRFTVTRSKGNVIQQVDGFPAVDIYRRYLGLDSNESFFKNVVEFPMFCEYDNNVVIRDALKADDEGFLYCSNDISEGTTFCLSYGEPSLIMDDISSVCEEIRKFTPDTISIVSCVARNMFWQNQDVMPELGPFNIICPIRGYLSKGEFIREAGRINQHNTTLVVAYMREGPVKDIYYDDYILNMDAEIPLASRMGTFISRITEELEESMNTINAMNKKLEYVATMDSLTGISNRYVFDKMVIQAERDISNMETKYLMMFDVNGLKFVNDTFGHSEGDVLIKAASNAINSIFSKYGTCFRIGGDEFAAIVDFESEDALKSVCESFYAFLDNYNRRAMHALSIAFGYSSLVDNHGEKKTSSDWKMDADINMYKDKAKFHPVEMDEFNGNLSSFIKCIMSLIDNKDKYTAYHSVRVQKMSLAIAGCFDLDGELLKQLSLSAYLHDIGKIGISDLILSKSGKLSSAEFDMIQQTPIISKKILMQSDDTKDIADIVLHHHERWDGKGYPDGLTGESIPLCSRIICIADSIDAMLNKRYYRDAMSADECYRELSKNSGKMYDPDILNVVLMNFGTIIKEGMSESMNISVDEDIS